MEPVELSAALDEADLLGYDAPFFPRRWDRESTRSVTEATAPPVFSLPERFETRTSVAYRLGSRHLVVTLPGGVDPGEMARRILELLAEVEPEQVEDYAPPGSPTAQLLVSAVGELQGWLGLTQKQVMNMVGMSPSTVMAWKRDPATHPRQKNIPVLVKLWAAVSGALDEFGLEETLHHVWRRIQVPGAPTDGSAASNLADALIDITDDAGRSALDLDDGYDPEAPLPQAAAAEAGDSTLHAAPAGGEDDPTGG